MSTAENSPASTDQTPSDQNAATTSSVTAAPVSSSSVNPMADSVYSELVYNLEEPQSLTGNYTPYRRGSMDDWEKRDEEVSITFELLAHDRVASMDNYGQPIEAVRRASLEGKTVAETFSQVLGKPATDSGN
ncbi:hypothetical protein BV898_12168 [Hypsibius exemplaris]|uniref:Uncharacterized protein n=1 Tax=Hypsibius exemplaris TaxID=2072580 RepID=A0A1W0WEI4_HYPEX|nr:hypothetical protein BV898_12168 [Hypsibius exemplaris]